MPTVSGPFATARPTSMTDLRFGRATPPRVMPASTHGTSRRPTSARPPTLAQAPVALALARLIGDVASPAPPDALSSELSGIAEAKRAADAQRKRSIAGSTLATMTAASSIIAPKAGEQPRTLIGY